MNARILSLLAAVLAVPGSQSVRATRDDAGPAAEAIASRDSTLFEVRQQCREVAAFFPIDSTLARRWVPPGFTLAIDEQGMATGGIILMDSPRCFCCTTPNSPLLPKSENMAPASVVHLWIMLRGPAEVLLVPGADVTSPTQYAYAVAELVTHATVFRLYQRSGRNVIRIRRASLIDRGERHTGRIVFEDGSRITLEARTPTRLRTPLRLGGNIWSWHARIGPGTAGEVNQTRVMFLALAPGSPGKTRVTIHADAGTPFERIYGTRMAVSSRASFFRPNNIVNNSSLGKLAWTVYPPDTLHPPPASP